MIAIGRLKYKRGSNSYNSYGSASLIKFRGNIYVATAAHCVFDLKTNKTNQDIYFELTTLGKKIF